MSDNRTVPSILSDTRNTEGHKRPMRRLRTLAASEGSLLVSIVVNVCERFFPRTALFAGRVSPPKLQDTPQEPF
jgi:hypothetical protein